MSCKPGIRKCKLDDAAEAERLIRDLARLMEKEAPGVSGSILEGHDEMLTVNRLRLPPELRRSLACTNVIESMQGTIRRVTRNVKHWRDASMALRWAAAGMLVAKAGFRRLKAHRQLRARRAPGSTLRSHGSAGQLPPSCPACDCPLVLWEGTDSRFLLGARGGR